MSLNIIAVVIVIIIIVIIIVIVIIVQFLGATPESSEDPESPPFELWSKLLVSPLIAPIVVPYTTPCKEFRL